MDEKKIDYERRPFWEGLLMVFVGYAPPLTLPSTPAPTPLLPLMSLTVLPLNRQVLRVESLNYADTSINVLNDEAFSLLSNYQKMHGYS